MTPDTDRPRRYARRHPLVAWGVRRTAAEWAADARCVGGRDVLEARLRMGWQATMALATPSDPNQTEAFGDTKAVGDWATAPRCVVSDELLRSRSATGWHAEAAMTVPLQDHQRRRETMLTVWGETKSVVDWAEDVRCQVMLGTLRKRLREGWAAEDAMRTPRRVGHVLTAWGETKSLAEWTRDARAKGDRGTMRKRLQKGWAPEAVVAGRQ